MQETLNFLNIIDSRLKRTRDSTPKTSNRISLKRSQRFPYARAIDFKEEKYRQYPEWLTQKEGFIDFMYRNYEDKLMSIPHICEQDSRPSDQRYFLSLYLQQVPLLANLPPPVTDIVLTHLRTRYCLPGQTVHPGGPPAFLAVVFVGALQYRTPKRTVAVQKNEVLFPDAFHGRPHQPVVCRQQSILLTLDVSVYALILERLRSEIEQRERDEVADMLKSTFFSELHIKEKKARALYSEFALQFYFDGQVVAEAGGEVQSFSMIYRGAAVEESNIYIREHNKWPLPARKWEVRAVYNSYHKRNRLARFDFFGDEEIVTNSKFKSKYIAQGWLILFTMPAPTFTASLTTEDIKRLKKYRAEHVDINYGDFEHSIRDRVKSLSAHKAIIKKAITASLAHRDNITPRKLRMIGDFEKSMLTRTFFQEHKHPEL